MTLESSILQNIHKLPESLQQSVLLYTEFLVSRHTKKLTPEEGDSTSPKQKLTGSMKGTFALPLHENFDDPLEEFEEYTG